MEPFLLGRTPSSRSVSDPLLTFRGARLVILGLLDPVADDTEGFLQEAGCSFAIRPFEAHRLDLNFARRSDDDFNGWFHTVEMVSLILPLDCWARRTKCPFLRASAVALWTP